MTSINITHLIGGLIGAGFGLATMMAAPPVNADAVGLNEPVFGNTITIDIVGAYHAVRYIDPDHSWRDESNEGELRGTWAVEGANVCFTQTDPTPEPGRERICNPNVPHKLGDSWNNTDPVTGNMVVIGLVGGRK
jgi:hypothetical protein